MLFEFYTEHTTELFLWIVYEFYTIYRGNLKIEVGVWMDYIGSFWELKSKINM